MTNALAKTDGVPLPPVEQTESPVLSVNSMEALVMKVEQEVDLAVRLKVVCIRLTNPKDWTNQNGKPYLEATGAQKIRKRVGVCWSDVKKLPVEEYEDGHYSIYYEGNVYMKDPVTGERLDEIVMMGGRTSRDPFFTTRYIKRGEKSVKTTLPPSEVDMSDVTKAAFTNFQVNAITGYLGIKGFTWEDLNEGGIQKTDVEQIQYKKKGKSNYKPPYQSNKGNASSSSQKPDTGQPQQLYGVTIPKSVNLFTKMQRADREKIIVELYKQKGKELMMEITEYKDEALADMFSQTISS